MIPSEVAGIADLIWADWQQLGEHDFREVLEAAQRIYDAGYRKPVTGGE